MDEEKLMDEIRVVTMFERMGDKTVKRDFFKPDQRMAFYFEPPLTDDGEFTRWYDFEWISLDENNQELTFPDEAPPVALVSKSYSKVHKKYELVFVNLTSNTNIHLQVTAHAERFRVIAPYTIKRGIQNKDNFRNMEGNNMENPTIITGGTTIYNSPTTLTLKPGKAGDIDINSSDPSRAIADIFFYDDSSNGNMRTALTGKMHIKPNEWKLFFHNADPNLTVTLHFDVREYTYFK
ncbi:hypothetical protein QNH16_24685 [Peribacillus frigoritolerans]|uniref:hypothetical protein n=1 Tax=Peribacillus frigoritolerans TaxID=450367 RepID=UPI0024BF6483|nr:hypothetical protein [Peribacillus frigoritolerans]WHY13874.1 hypothetical protein QNH16_24685 [Peribacillus frigoritolerans]